MLSTESLRDQLKRYADQQVSAEVFEEWLASESWNMHRWAPVGLQHLVASLQASLSEHSSGAITEANIDFILRDRFQQLRRAADVQIFLDASLLAEMHASAQMRSTAAAKLAEPEADKTSANSLTESPNLFLAFEAAAAQ